VRKFFVPRWQRSFRGRCAADDDFDQLPRLASGGFLLLSGAGLGFREKRSKGHGGLGSVVQLFLILLQRVAVLVVARFGG